jgi:hypothetical protein
VARVSRPSGSPSSCTTGGCHRSSDARGTAPSGAGARGRTSP